MWNSATESPVKEEKIEIKRGKLKWPEDKMKFVKKWKQRYFVFCEVIKGSSRWLKLLYYKNKVAYTRSELPMGYIDITVADAIKIMGSDKDGRKHIINISTPGRECFLSAPSCEEMYLWILALRAYKFNDESKFPWISQRSDSISSSLMRAKPSNVECPIGKGAAASPEGIRPPLPTPDELSSPVSATYASLPPKSDYALDMSNEKLRRRFLYCKDCLQRRDSSYIAPEDYYPVMPTSKPAEVRGSPETPKPFALPASDALAYNIYDVILPSPYDLARVSEPTENEYPSINISTSMSQGNRGESNSSWSSDTESFPSGGSVEASRGNPCVPKMKVDNEEIEEVAEAGLINSAQGINRAGSPSFGSYVMMRSPRAVGSEKERKVSAPRITRSPTQESSPRPARKLAKTLSVPYKLDVIPTIQTQQTVESASTMCLSTVGEANTQRKCDTYDPMSSVQSQASQELSLVQKSMAVKDSPLNQTVAIPPPLRKQPKTPPNKPARSQAQKPHHELTHDLSPTYVNRTLHDEIPQGQSSTPFHRPCSGQLVVPPTEMKSHRISNLANDEVGKEIADSIEESLHVASGGSRVKNQYVSDHSVGWGARVLVRKGNTLIEKAVDVKMEGGEQGLNDHNSNIMLSRMFEKLEFVHIADV